MAKKQRKIIDTSRGLPKVDPQKIIRGLRAHLVSFPPEITKEESEQYEPIGDPVILPRVTKDSIYRYGTRTLNQCGKTLDDAVGYRILEQNEELEFRKRYHNQFFPLIQFYQKPQE